MNKLLLSIAPLLLSVAACFGQDTLKVEPSRFYSSVHEPFQGKDFAFSVQRSREDIVFSDSHQRIEYCYYYDTRRICFGTTYRISSDSTLDMDGEVWRYTQRGRRYFLERYFLQKVNDTRRLAGGEAMQGALIFYRSLRHASQMGVANSKALFDELKTRFEGQGRFADSDATETEGTEKESLGLD